MSPLADAPAAPTGGTKRKPQTVGGVSLSVLKRIAWFVFGFENVESLKLTENEKDAVLLLKTKPTEKLKLAFEEHWLVKIKIVTITG